jgi:hypothetical protein
LLSQQTPSTQNAELHWVLAVQATPRASFGTQAPAAEQYAALSQSVSLVHFVEQAVPSGLHPKPPHGVELARHARAPLHTLLVRTPIEHAPPGQSVRGSLPSSTGPQVPSDFPVAAARHDSHVPLHAPSQQTPSTQLALLH